MSNLLVITTLGRVVNYERKMFLRFATELSLTLKATRCFNIFDGETLSTTVVYLNAFSLKHCDQLDQIIFHFQFI